MNTMTNTANRTNTLVSLLIVIALMLGSLALAGCTGGSKDEQDNCYGEDVPVVNE